MKNKVFNYGIRYFERLEEEDQRKKWQVKRIWAGDTLKALLGGLLFALAAILLLVVCFQLG